MRAPERGVNDTSTLTPTSASLLRYANHEVIRALLRRENDDEHGEDDDDGDFESLDRRAREIETKLVDVERRSIDAHADECENLLQLQGEVHACDGILSDMEQTLKTFQDDLGRISMEIRELQRSSEDLRVRSANRARAERKLGDAVEALSVPPSLINAVFNGDFVGGDGGFVEGVRELEVKLDHLSVSASKGAGRAVNDVAPELERLRVKAVDRAWAFLYGEFAALKKPRANVQLIQENTLARHAPLIEFLRKRGPEVYWEVKSTYADVVGKVLKTAMTSYLESLKRVTKAPRARVLLASRTRTTSSSTATTSATTDVASVAANALAGMFAGMTSSPASSSASKADETNGDSLFDLGNRARAMHAAETEPPLVVHRQSDKVTQEAHDYEELFRSAHRLLIDTATFEYAFCEVFWKGEREMFETVFTGPLMAYNDFVAQGVAQSGHDAVGLLIAIRVNNAHRRVMNRRRVPGLDAYIDNLNMILWPKFKHACDAHVKSLEDMRESFEPNPESPSFIVKRYANFVVALTTVAHSRMGAASADETNVINQVDLFLDRLRRSMYDCVTSKLCASLKASPRSRSAYLVKSYDYICSTLSSLTNLNDDDGVERCVEDDELATELASLHFFEEKLIEESKAFVSHALAERFPSITTISRRRRSGEGANIDAHVIRDALVAFQRDWRDALKATHEDCVSCFGAARDWRANDLFRRCLAELVSTYFALIDDDTDESIVVTKPTFTLEGNRYVSRSNERLA